MATDSPDGWGATLPTYGPDEVADTRHLALAANLESAVGGDVRFDEYAQVLYATDGSIYGARPAGVVVPEDEADVVAAVRVAADHDAPVLPRGAGIGNNSTEADPVAPGASCRTQLADRPGSDGERPPHPVEKLADALR